MSSNKLTRDSALVSIVMPTHNRSGFLIEAVESVVNQTYSNWELIIIADACTDNSSEVIKPYLEDKRITFHESKENVGGAQARNIGMNQVSGDFVAFLDDDDVWLPNKLKVQVQFLHEHLEVSLVYCNFSQWYSNGKKKEVKMRRSVDLDSLLTLNSIGSFSFVMLRTIQLVDNRIDAGLKSAQDWDLWVRVLKKSNSVALNCNVNLVDYRIQGQKKISVNKDSVSKGYEKWYNNHKKGMTTVLKDYHLTIIKVKTQLSMIGCFKVWASFFLKYPTKFYLTILILKRIYAQG